MPAGTVVTHCASIEYVFDCRKFVGGEQYFGRQYSHHVLVGSMLTR